MIIICPCGEKKFEIDSNLIPEEGRLLKCGSCDQTWFFNKDSQEDINTENIKLQNNEIKKEVSLNPIKKKNKIIYNDVSKPPNNSGSEIVKYEPQANLTFGRVLNYLLVSIISFVALIIILDTFKSPLYMFFRNLELIMYNLFETLKDLLLFIKDLN